MSNKKMPRPNFAMYTSKGKTLEAQVTQKKDEIEVIEQPIETKSDPNAVTTGGNPKETDTPVVKQKVDVAIEPEKIDPVVTTKQEVIITESKEDSSERVEERVSVSKKEKSTIEYKNLEDFKNEATSSKYNSTASIDAQNLERLKNSANIMGTNIRILHNNIINEWFLRYGSELEKLAIKKAKALF